MEQLVILIVIGLISLVNWILQKAAEKREAAQTRRQSGRVERREVRRNIYTERPTVPEARPAQDPLKELMEALGLPPEEVSQPVARRAMEPEIFEEEEFVSLEEPAPPPVPVVERAPAWQAPKQPWQPDRKTAELASAFAAVDQKSSASGLGANIRHLLAGRDAQRKAVVLAEIFGTPRGLAPGSLALNRW